MTINKRKKSSRQRGSHTHGWGSKKKHRGKGNKGGSGNSSSGKRSDARKPSFWKNQDYFGKHGFGRKGLKKSVRGINISQLELKIDSYIKEKKASEEGGVYHIKLADIGFEKLLGSGKASRKFRIETRKSSKNAEERIREAGGEVIKSEE